ncbi:MAG TPA: DUF3419 family protein [Sphingobacterium sp.]|nr:DUF3419 family protein [Sphingobacterium sp.]
MGNLDEKVDFSIIRYANCWEDPEVLLKGLEPKGSSKILSIASAGDNSFSLLTTNPELVVAVDVNLTQLYLVELKKAVIRSLDYEDVLVFLGFHEGADRLKLFQQLKPMLTADVRQYWERHADTITRGIIHQGKFERYFQLFARSVLPFIHRKRQVEQLLAPKDQLEQMQFYHKKWNTWRWRLFFNIFFSRFVMGKWGRDPQFLKEVGIDVSAYIFQKAEKQLKKVSAQQNPLLRYNLTGNFGSLLPHYLHFESYLKIKDNLDSLVIRQGFAEQVAQDYGRFDRMNLSNIFEYMDKKLFTETAEKLIQRLEDDGRIGYWNLMVPRRISGIFPSEVRYLSKLSQQLTEDDDGFFYNQFIVEQK